ncbi:MAG: hypothetical protein HZB80_04910 [Deltaproteobacteria bacterium]|nr:hypothetical protein [Deltaproteobacteria bacterium]
MLKKKYRIFSVIFSICFSIYAASPLLYTHEDGKTDKQTGANSSNLKLFLVDILLSNLTHHKSQAKHSGAVHVLLKKKRATLSSDKLNMPEKQEKNLAKVADSPVPSEILYRIAPQNNKPKLNEYFYLSHSGLSPPLA